MSLFVKQAVTFSLIILWTPFVITVSMIASLFSKRLTSILGQDAFAWGFLNICRLFMGVKVDLGGKEGRAITRQTGHGPCVYVMNHESTVDIAVAIACIPADIKFIAKNSLIYTPFVGLYLWRTGMIFIDRGNSTKARKSLALAAEKVRAGATVFVFPEGTRGPGGTLLPFKKGAFALAIDAQVPIVPVAVTGTAQVLPRDSIRFMPGHIRVRIGAPIPTQGLTMANRDELTRRTRMEMEKLLSSAALALSAQGLGEEVEQKTTVALQMLPRNADSSTPSVALNSAHQ